MTLSHSKAKSQGWPIYSTTMTSIFHIKRQMRAYLKCNCHNFPTRYCMERLIKEQTKYLKKMNSNHYCMCCLICVVFEARFNLKLQLLIVNIILRVDKRSLACFKVLCKALLTSCYLKYLVKK